MKDKRRQPHSKPKALCLECGKSFTKGRSHATFCGTKCRKDFNNRRATRGAELYDIIMTMRFERKDAADKKLWALTASVASAYRTADKDRRGGRKSWDSSSYKRIPMAYIRGDGR